MPVDTIGALLGFLLLVAPGVIVERAGRLVRPERVRSSLVEISEIALVSAAIDVAAVLFVLGATTCLEHPDLYLLVSDPAYRRENTYVLLWVGVMVVLVAWAFAGTGAWLRYRRAGTRGLYVRDAALWSELSAARAAGDVKLAVLLDSEVFYWGGLASIDVGTEEGAPFLVLHDAHVRRKGSDLVPVEGYQRVFIPLPTVREMWLTVVGEGEP